MISLVLVFCMIRDPSNCIEQRPRFTKPLTDWACIANGQTAAERYLESHPDWRLVKWRCERNVVPQAPA